MTNDKPDHQEAVQRTPTGAEIPVPTWGDVMRDLGKLAPPVPKRPAKDDDAAE